MRRLTSREVSLYIESCSDPAGQRITLARYAAAHDRSLLWGAR